MSVISFCLYYAATKEPYDFLSRKALLLRHAVSCRIWHPGFLFKVSIWTAPVNLRHGKTHINKKAGGPSWKIRRKPCCTAFGGAEPFGHLRWTVSRFSLQKARKPAWIQEKMVWHLFDHAIMSLRTKKDATHFLPWNLNPHSFIYLFDILDF